MSERAPAVAVAERPDSGDVRLQPIVYDDEAAIVLRHARRLEPEVVRVRLPARCQEEMRPLHRRAPVGALGVRDNPPGVSAEPDASSVDPDVDAFLREDAVDRGGDLLVFATDQPRPHLDDGHLGAEPAKHLSELEADVAAADDQEMPWHRVQIHHRAVRKERDSIQSLQGRDGGAPADVDEDPIGAQHLVRHRDLRGAAEPGVSRKDVAARQTAKPLLHAAARPLGDRVFPLLDAPHVDAHAAADEDAVVAGAPCQVSGIGARHHRLRRDAARVDARAAESMALDDGDRHAGLRQPLRQGRAGLPGPDDDRVVVPAHECNPRCP